MIDMTELSLSDKLNTLYDLVSSSSLFLFLFFAILAMIVDVLFISKKSKRTKIIYTLLSFAVCVLLLLNYLDEFLSIINEVNVNFVKIINFPTLLEYLSMFVISLIIVVCSSFSKSVSKGIKLLNLFVVISNLFIFFIILDQISINNIDVKDIFDIYTNSNLMVLFETSIFIFLAWILILIVYEIIVLLIEKNKPIDNFYEEPELPNTIQELRKQELIPEPQIEYIVVEKEKLDDLFTLEEYKEMKKLLEQIKNKNAD